MSAFSQQGLSEVCDISMGQAPKGVSYNTSGEGYALIAGAGDFGELTPEPSKYTNAPTKLSRPGDLILCIRATIGDRNWSDGEYCLGRGVAGLRARDEVLSQAYLWHWLDHAAPQLRAKGRGATFLQVSKRDIASLQIPLPPLAEQKRIAAILDTADALRAKRRKSLAQLDTLLQSVFLDMFGDPVTNPMGWRVTRISEVATVGTGSTPPRSEKEHFGGDVPWVKSTEVDWGTIDRTGECVTPSGVEAANLRLYPRGSIVLALYGQGKTRAKSAVLGIEATVNQACCAIVPTGDCSTAYLFELLKQSYWRLRRASRGGNQKNLNMGIVKNFSVPVPPMELQEHFSTVTESIERRRGHQRAHLAELDTLFASLQSRAFRGDL